MRRIMPDPSTPPMFPSPPRIPFTAPLPASSVITKLVTRVHDASFPARTMESMSMEVGSELFYDIRARRDLTGRLTTAQFNATSVRAHHQLMRGTNGSRLRHLWCVVLTCSPNFVFEHLRQIPKGGEPSRSSQNVLRNEAV